MCCVQLVLSARCALNLCNGVAGTQHKSVYVHTYGKNSVITAEDELVSQNIITFSIGRARRCFWFC